ncbi:MAG: UvrD-helicase domain-containing protein, partial [Sphingomonadales bacterium]|nr:UvrD-helicase domain-containing protein [Sphingomonadales bacterium]
MSDTPSLLSLEQRRATRVDASVWVGASAGTGKTHMLTARVLRLMLTGTPPDKILCVTFTKAAAAEMAIRITDELGDWVRLSDERLDAQIYARVDEKADDKMRQRARSLFAEVLDLPGGLRIKTIHSFCQSLLARFPVEAGLPPHFQVLDDRSSQEALNDATEQAIAMAGENADSALGQAVRTIAIRASEDTFAKLMSTLAHERGHLAKLMHRFKTVDALNAAIARTLGIEPEDTVEGLIHAAITDTHMNEATLAQLGELADEGSAKDIEKGGTLRAYSKARADERSALFDAYENIFLTKSHTIQKTIQTKKIMDEGHPLYDAALDEAHRLLAFNEKRRAADVLEKTAALMQLAFDVLYRYQTKKAQISALDYDDLIQKTDELLSRPGVAPWVLYKMDGGLDHILIDEAQDTNPEQWRIVEALSEDFYTGESARSRIGTVLAVGDVKQSIYSFQRADPASFKQAQQRVETRATAAGLYFESVAMDRSYRSTSAVLNMVDACFIDADATRSLTLGADAIAHDVARIGMAGQVELWPKEPVVKKADPEDWVLPLKQEREASSPARLAARMAERIRVMISDQEQLPARGRAVNAGDIMVLVPRRTEFVDHLIRELKGRNVPVMG